MASVINSIRNITGDRWWFIKITVFAYIAFFVFLNTDIIFENNQTNLILWLSILIIYLGANSIMIGRNVNNESPLLPSFMNIPLIIFRGIISFIMLIPFSVIFYLIINFIHNTFQFEPLINFIIYICVSIFLTPFIIIPFVLYSVYGKFQDAFKINVIFEVGGNFIVQVLSYIVQYLFTIFLAILILYVAIKQMFGFCKAIEFLIGYAIAITIFSFFSYCSDMYGDVIPEIKSKKKSL